ncbi:MAG: hypothetical protein DRO11_06940 [Methanobacteriota archaeon]|nr:MAG: hypothetical protein DRO11_06940 [Euryarchaeota archaeon]
MNRWGEYFWHYESPIVCCHSCGAENWADEDFCHYCCAPLVRRLERKEKHVLRFLLTVLVGGCLLLFLGWLVSSHGVLVPH